MASTEVTTLGHSWLGCEHIFLGLLANEQSAASEVLRQTGITLGLARRGILDIVGTDASAAHLPGGGLTETPRASIVRALAALESERLGGGGWIEPEHILLALMTEGKSTPIALLMRLGTDLRRLRECLLLRLGVPRETRERYVRERDQASSLDHEEGTASSPSAPL